MRKAVLLSLILLMSVALPVFAVDKHQSYISYDDGGTLVRQSDDGREIEARINLPIFPGDEIVTSRRGRTEVRLSDGNVLAIDRATSVRLQSILDSYEGEDAQTVIELRQGKIGVHRTEIGREVVRLDTKNATYVAPREAIYFVESDSRGSDRLVVFDGSIEVRTPNRTTRVRAGERASVDNRGIYDFVDDVEHGTDDFERWFARRSDRRGGNSARYLDKRLSYWGDDLDSHGRWVMVTGIGWSWRPYVSVGWRPYYNGYWHRSRRGYMTWVSYEPWGWGPYHYGRWAFDSMYGWVWVPGGGYAPAWVYWMYQPGMIGWAPAGWWDCYPRYYDWAYRPYQFDAMSFGVGFYGRIRVSEMDLRPWTFIDANTIVSNRVDRAALTVDAVKQRLGRTSGGFATVSNEPARFTNEQFRDPAEAVRSIARRGIGNPSTAGGAAAPVTDVTSFFRRDADVGAAVRDRITRPRGGDTATAGTTTVRGGGAVVSTPSAGGLAPIGRGNVAPIGRGSVAPATGGSVAPVTGGAVAPVGGSTPREGGINRGRDTWRTPATTPGASEPSDRSTGAIRRRGDEGENPSVGRGGETAGRGDGVQRGEGAIRSVPSDSWRRRPSTTPDDAAVSPGRSSSGRSSEPSSADVPRRVIDGIGGARVRPRDDSGSSSGSGGGRIRSVSPSPRSGGDSGSSRVDRPSSSSSSGSSSGGAASGSTATSSSNRSGGEVRSSGGNRGEGGAIRRPD